MIEDIKIDNKISFLILLLNLLNSIMLISSIKIFVILGQDISDYLQNYQVRNGTLSLGKVRRECKICAQSEFIADWNKQLKYERQHPSPTAARSQEWRTHACNVALYHEIKTRYGLGCPCRSSW